MAQLCFSVHDDQRVLRARVGEEVAESLLASLSADPETIDEFQRAMNRFFHPAYAKTVCATWKDSPDAARRQRWQDAVSIDLPGRLLVSQWDQTQRKQDASYFDANGQPLGRFSYDLSRDWLLRQSDIDLRDLALSRREQRRLEQVDVRGVLFGQPMIEFLAEQCQRAFADEQPRLSQDWGEQRKNGWFRQDDHVYRITRRIHGAWLMSVRADLGGRRVRDAMLADRTHVATDISHRISQWAIQNSCPAGLSRSDSAYLGGGLGAHEIILYYDLVRELLFCYFEDAVQHSDGVRSGQHGSHAPIGTRLLDQRRDEWMDAPQWGVLAGLTPREAIERERLRLPLVEPDGHAVVDEDCPVCRMSADLGLGPTFVYLDELHFDDDFAFSMHACEEEWKREQAEFEARCRKYDLERDARLEGESELMRPADAIWQRVYVNQEFLGRSLNEDVMAIGFFLAELVEDIKRESGDKELVKQINLHFDNLAPASRPEGRCVLQPVISRLGETIDDVAQQCPVLAEKCLDLQNHLARISEMLDD